MYMNLVNVYFKDIYAYFNASLKYIYVYIIYILYTYNSILLCFLCSLQ